MIIIDGKEIASKVKEEISEEVNKIKAKGGKIPHLAAILVGNDGASQTYVNSKVKSCEQVGFKSTLIKFEESISENELIAEIQKLNNSTEIDGYIVQLPLPKHIDEEKVNMTVSPAKDVDGFHPVNVGRMSLGLPAFVSATPAGIMELLIRYNIETSGKHCVVLGRSNIVGRPVSILMSQKGKNANSTVTVCHSGTKNLKEICSSADILIVAIGKPEFVTADMVKTGAVVIDVGIHRIEAPETKSGFKLKGDVKFDEVAEKCSYITPVPGGVGPMTIVSLLKNTLISAKGEVKF
ncbi:MAG: bifunctional 5,10-methylene-tetrahydrofolate dehydrogenase/5,10-methylene-tetrahydrofolate cyclohydrolase [Bacteroidales bacterium]|nr:bifunctional 5,10-methylene-tetrahydrofolate dehydrogenase/5,10-methylene-tetrahydrofolate cyclohydrolase [Bacteroidales bacterium]